MAAVERLPRASLGSLDVIGQGGQGKVYLAPDLTLPDVAGPLVFKAYKRSEGISIGGLDSMAIFRQRLAEDERAVLDVLANWPVRVVEGAEGRADGVIIPLIPPGFFHELTLPDGSTRRRPRDGQYLCQPPDRCQRLGIPMASLGDRYRFCRDLAFAVGFLHRRSVCLGDISFANATYAMDVYPAVYLVDCDAFRLSGNAPVVPQLHTPDWAPPEGLRVQSQRTDLYKLGLFVLRVLSPKPLSAQNRDSDWADEALEPEGRTLLRRALASDPTPRTTAKEWHSYFSAVLRTRTLETSEHRSRMPKRLATVSGGG